MHARDPKGYYAILELGLGASDQQIKHAYRRRAMALHPDRNPGRDTTVQFQRLNEAFAVLSDPGKRAAYDVPLQRPAQPPAPLPEPIKCSRCGKVSAQPRVVVFRSVRSFLVVTVRKPVSGVFCSECARRQALKASALTWLLGWWGFPWGPVYSLQALLDNLLGGTQPPLENARLLAWQAYAFYNAGRPAIAYAIAREALQFCAKVKTTTREAARAADRDDLAARLQAFIGNSAPPTTRLKNSWGNAHRFLPAHLAGLGLAIGAIVLATTTLSLGRDPADVAPAVPAAVPRPAWVRPPLAPNGQPWPSQAGYLTGEPQGSRVGQGQVVVDNTQNSADVLLRLMALGNGVPQALRQVFVPAGGRFTLEQVAPGRYEVQYQDLGNGAQARSQAMELREAGGRHNVVTLALRRTASGG